MAEGFSVAGQVVMVTGGARGIGRALAERFAADGARAVVVTDLDGATAAEVAAELPGGVGSGHRLDVTDAAAVTALVDRVEAEIGPIGLCCSNAGVALGDGLGEDSDWAQSWAVHVMAHVYLARAVLPTMAGRGGGRLLLTASAAGLLTNTDSAPYTVTKHGTVALAEWLAITHEADGIRVSCLCPQGVRTAMTANDAADSATRRAGAFLEPAEVAASVTDALAADRFLVLPHPEVAGYEQRRAADRDRWLHGMSRLLGARPAD